MAGGGVEEASAVAEQGAALEPKLGERIMVLRQPWLDAILDGTKMAPRPWRFAAASIAQVEFG